MKKHTYEIGLLVGRFQPFHKGHEYLVKQAFKYCEKIIIAIGSSNRKNADNPFGYFTRRKMLKSFIEHERLHDRIIKIIPSPDILDDYKWRDTLLRKAGEIDVVIGNNDKGVNRFFEEAGFPILRILYKKRDVYEGTKIRRLIEKGKSLKGRVSDYLLSHMGTPLLRPGL